ncbi:CPBP family intramembrane glutamic endopeptidase [Phormidium sp. CCY1219]|uniref:CPBP family intramembrane glutamic endopeptidase n=1 Tax=Phormidium sp. CCY1219 TaxID=2886104 RepID=UPI002D1F1802|nr:CPBP family intramembrane glutamic endopeptidase [Phormidium sp. CCY1219]MEB3826727.1 CPBP family intramembrane metalloprotease [Phormidium sp. CCY1219]
MTNDLDQSKKQRPTGPWGIGATIGFSVVVAIAYLLTQVAVSILFLVLSVDTLGDINAEKLQSLSENGLLNTLAFIASGTVGLGLTWWFAKMRENYPVEEYLSLKKPNPKQLGKWLLIILAFLLASDALTYFFPPPIVPEWTVKLYQTAGFLPLLYFAVAIVAPIFEEIFFRGFLFEGFRASPLGNTGALAISALSWAIVHLQYDAYYIFIIAIFGLILGYARLKTQSIYVPIAMHGLNNLIALIETAIYLQFFAQ